MATVPKISRHHLSRDRRESDSFDIKPVYYLALEFTDIGIRFIAEVPVIPICNFQTNPTFL